jgi:DNA-binding CsgD family transcriptional regulator
MGQEISEARTGAREDGADTSSDEDDDIEQLIEHLITRRSEALEQIAGLSPRQKEVLFLVAQGQSAKEIGRTLGISPRTVDIHRQQMMFKLGLDCIAGVTRIANEATLLDYFPQGDCTV